MCCRNNRCCYRCCRNNYCYQEDNYREEEEYFQRPERSRRERCYPQPEPCRPYLTQLLRTFNSVPQAGTTTASLINLGTQFCTTGTAITYVAPNTIYFNTPGIYFVRYTGQFIGTNTTDTVVIQPLLGGNPIAGTATTVTFPVAGATTPVSQGFYVTVTTPTTLTFSQTSTAVTDTIASFDVSVTRISTPYMEAGCGFFY